MVTQKKRKRIVVAGILLLLIFFFYRHASAPPSKEDVVGEAIRQGAILISCENGHCYDPSGEDLGNAAPNGEYLIYPDRISHGEVERTRQALKASY